MRAVFLLTGRCVVCGNEFVPTPADRGECDRCKRLRGRRELRRQHLQRQHRWDWQARFAALSPPPRDGA